MREFFPNNAVEYFVSYYDYYQPEAYVPQRDLYIEKDSSINEHIEQMRLSATKSLLERRDTVIVATRVVHLRHRRPGRLPRDAPGAARSATGCRSATCCSGWSAMQYTRNDIDFRRGTFRVRGDVDRHLPGRARRARRCASSSSTTRSSRSTLFDPLTGRVRQKVPRFTVYPSRHYVTPRATVAARASRRSRRSCDERLDVLHEQGKLRRGAAPASSARATTSRCCRSWASARASRTTRATSPARAPGEPPPTLLDYLPADALLIIDESHVTIAAARRDVPRRPLAQGDAGRVRLPPAVGAGQPAAEVRGVRGARCARRLRLGHAGGLRGRSTPAQVVEQVVRPTGLVDPQVEVRPACSAGRRPAVARSASGWRAASACWSRR